MIEHLENPIVQFGIGVVFALIIVGIILSTGRMYNYWLRWKYRRNK